MPRRRPGPVCRAGCARPGRPRASRPPRRGGGPAGARAGGLALAYARPPGPLASRRAGAAPPSRPRDRPRASLSLREAASAVARASSPSFLRALPRREHPHPRRKLGRHVHHRLARGSQPPRQVPTQTTGVLHRLGRRSGKRFAQRSRDLKPARSCGKEARSSSSPVASSTAATATEPLWGSTPMRTFMGAYLRFGRISAPSACAKDIPTSVLCSHTSFESLRPPRAPAGRKPRTSQPTLCGRQEVRERSLYNRYPRSLAAARPPSS